MIEEKSPILISLLSEIVFSGIYRGRTTMNLVQMCATAILQGTLSTSGGQVRKLARRFLIALSFSQSHWAWHPTKNVEYCMHRTDHRVPHHDLDLSGQMHS